MMIEIAKWAFYLVLAAVGAWVNYEWNKTQSVIQVGTEYFTVSGVGR